MHIHTHKTTHIQDNHTMHMLCIHLSINSAILQCTHNTHTYLRNVQLIVYQPLMHIAIISPQICAFQHCYRCITVMILWQITIYSYPCHARHDLPLYYLSICQDSIQQDTPTVHLMKSSLPSYDLYPLLPTSKVFRRLSISRTCSLPNDIIESQLYRIFQALQKFQSF